MCAGSRTAAVWSRQTLLLFRWQLGRYKYAHFGRRRRRLTIVLLFYTVVLKYIMYAYNFSTEEVSPKKKTNKMCGLEKPSGAVGTYLYIKRRLSFDHGGRYVTDTRHCTTSRACVAEEEIREEPTSIQV